MAQYLLAVNHSSEQYNASSAYGAYRDEDEMKAAYAATGAFNQKLVDAGVCVFVGGLTPPEQSTTVDGRGTHVTYAEGPVVENVEHLGGFWVIDVPDRDAALALAAEGSRACGQRIQVRAFQGA